MATRLTEDLDVALTPKEAEAILELWARQHSESEALQARTTVQDLAEAMSIPAHEVAAMLRQVRESDPVLPQQPLEEAKKRRRNRRLMVFAILFWLALMVGGFAIVYNVGRSRGARVRLGPATHEAAATVQSTGPENLPNGVTFEYRGYQLTGTAPNGTVDEKSIMSAIFDIVERVAGPSSTAETKVGNDEIAKALQTDDASNVSTHIAFETVKVTGGGKVFSTKMPIAIDGSLNVVNAVRQEQWRRLNIIANQILRAGQATERP